MPSLQPTPFSDTPLTIVLPVLNEAATLAPRLLALQPLRARGARVVVADGGSTDGTLALARPHADLALVTLRGRGAQMNAGAAAGIAPSPSGGRRGWGPAAQPAGALPAAANPDTQPPLPTHPKDTADVTLLSPGHSPVGLHVRTWLTATGAHSADRQEPQGERLCVMFLHDLREMEARLRTEKLAAMGRMSAAVAHEIRNPLAAIVQANALLNDDLHDPMHKHLSGMVQKNAERLIRITEEILDIARVQHQIGHSTPSAVMLDEAVAHIWRDWHEHDPAQRSAQVALCTAQTHVEFDPEHLRRVLINLLDNALRYRSGAPQSLQLLTHTNSTGQASVQVWSDGAPMDQSVERHLFEPFFSSESRSSGLGLYICRELCERHGATISYQRLARQTERGDVEGNAFSVHFRQASSLQASTSLFDTLVI